MRSNHKLKFKRRKYIHSIEQPLISLDLKYFMIQMKLRYLKSILQSRSSLLPSYCTYRRKKMEEVAKENQKQEQAEFIAKTPKKKKKRAKEKKQRNQRKKKEKLGEN